MSELFPDYQPVKPGSPYNRLLDFCRTLETAAREDVDRFVADTSKAYSRGYAEAMRQIGDLLASGTLGRELRDLVTWTEATIQADCAALPCTCSDKSCLRCRVTAIVSSYREDT
jgi:hypothetical protein